MKISTVTAYGLTNQGSATRTPRATSAASFMRRSGRRPAEEAGRPQEQYRDQEPEAHPLLHRRREEHGAHRFRHRDQDPAHEGARKAAHPADDNDVERGHGEPETARRLERQDRRDEGSRGAHARRADAEGGGVDAP